ncbi:MAG TPA: hypothetical protein DCF33_07150 [Saprospirales bacterium]|nr:hypothetical protein [Saprospirales bacterium]
MFPRFFHEPFNMKKNIYYFLFLILTGVLAAPLQAQIPQMLFHAELGGDEMLPPVNTQGKGLVSFLFTPDRTKVDVGGMLIRLNGTVTSVTIRQGKTGETGPVIFDLTPYLNDRHIIGQVTVPSILLPNLLTNSVYVEVKTTAHPTGEIRGQFAFEADLAFKSLLTSDQVNPPSNSNAVAYGGILYKLGLEDLIYAFAFRDLSSAMTSVALYDVVTGQLAFPPFLMGGATGGLIQGFIELDTIDPDFLKKALDCRYNVLINTVNYPQGEIMGKLEHVGLFGSLAPITSFQQIPPPTPPVGIGFSSSTPSFDLDSMTTWVFTNDTSTTSVALHIGEPNENGPQLFELSASAIPGLYVQKYAVTEQQLTDFAQGRFYIQVKTAANPDGAIRGVMKNTMRRGYAFDLCGVQMVPPTSSDALGVAVASVDLANHFLNYKVITDGLASAPVDAYFAQANVGANGIAFHGMPLTEPIIAGSHEIMAALGPIIENGGSYVQIGTMGNPNGEIRGQVRRGFTCPEVVSATSLEQVTEVNVSPVPFNDFLNVSLTTKESFEARLIMHDILGAPAYVQNINIVQGEQNMAISTLQLPAGFYSISLEIPTENASVLLKKVVKTQ